MPLCELSTVVIGRVTQTMPPSSAQIALARAEEKEPDEAEPSPSGSRATPPGVYRRVLGIRW